MRTEVIILAQGTQARLRGMSGYKQMLPLPDCGGIPIMGRTVQQLCHLLDGSTTITTVAWPKLGFEWVAALDDRQLPSYRQVTLPEPGNSSLKGISRYLEQRGDDHGFSKNVVLFGDVIYSWACLSALLRARDTWGFVGTEDLTASTGELWGVAWSAEHEQHMRGNLRDSMLRHPPFEDEYQPGQMRRWMSGWKRGNVAEHREHMRSHGFYTAIDDYTQDIDLPVHVAMLPSLSRAAAADDAAHGMLWTPPTGAAA